MKNLIVSAAVVALATSAASAQQAVQWRVEDGGNGHWYQIRPTTTTNWYDACGDAIRVGASLCSIESEAERAWIAGNIACDYVYLGGRQVRGSASPTSGWHWLTGHPVTLPLDCNDNPCLAGTAFEDGEQDFLHPDACWSVMGDWNISAVNGCAPTKWMRGLFEWSADCNNDGVVDYGQILAGQLVDANSNGTPDLCEGAPCRGDVVRDSQVNGVDLAAVLSQWGTPGSSINSADINDDGFVNGQDLAFVLGGWGPCSLAPWWATVLEVDPSPNVVTNPLLRDSIKATGLPWRVLDTATQVEMVLIPAGNFDMGCSPSSQYSCFSEEHPVHWVTISQPFYLSRYEVTQAQWTSVMGSNPSFFQGAKYPGSSTRPVEMITWDQVSAFLAVTGMRLPTEAEWEYAYRAGTTTAFHSMPGYPSGTNDDSLLDGIAWWGYVTGNAGGQTHPVGQLAGNGFGLHDMSGNVWEMISDWYAGNYYSASPLVNPQGPSAGTVRCLRGGCWDSLATNWCRSSHRNTLPVFAGSNVGFRVARNP
jgi:formylglycine-generating enzyme required for sulfatase activity